MELIAVDFMRGILIENNAMTSNCIESEEGDRMVPAPEVIAIPPTQRNCKQDLLDEKKNPRQRGKGRLGKSLVY